MTAHAVIESDPAARSDDGLDDEQNVCGIYAVGRPKCPPISVEMLVFGVPVQFEVDTGAASTLMSADTFREVSSNGGHGGTEALQVRCQAAFVYREHYTCHGGVQRRGEVRKSAHGPNLLGRDWLATLKLDWRHIQQVRNLGESPDSVVGKLKDEFRDVFSKELGCFKGVKVTFDVDTRLWHHGS